MRVVFFAFQRRSLVCHRRTCCINIVYRSFNRIPLLSSLYPPLEAAQAEGMSSFLFHLSSLLFFVSFLSSRYPAAFVHLCAFSRTRSSASSSGIASSSAIGKRRRRSAPSISAPVAAAVSSSPSSSSAFVLPPPLEIDDSFGPSPPKRQRRMRTRSSSPLSIDDDDDDDDDDSPMTRAQAAAAGIGGATRRSTRKRTASALAAAAAAAAAEVDDDEDDEDEEDEDDPCSPLRDPQQLFPGEYGPTSALPLITPNAIAAAAVVASGRFPPPSYIVPLSERVSASGGISGGGCPPSTSVIIPLPTASPTAAAAAAVAAAAGGGPAAAVPSSAAHLLATPSRPFPSPAGFVCTCSNLVSSLFLAHICCAFCVSGLSCFDPLFVILSFVVYCSLSSLLMLVFFVSLLPMSRKGLCSHPRALLIPRALYSLLFSPPAPRLQPSRPLLLLRVLILPCSLRAA